ncbi:MAG TPA: hypothetical protein VI603_17360 [Saprospiraceae bacterium]|nr:hypothetical protein [Saprospiraceae bacterium]
MRVRFADLNGDGEINVVDEGPGQEKEVLGSYHYYPYGMEMPARPKTVRTGRESSIQKISLTICTDTTGLSILVIKV